MARARTLRDRAAVWSTREHVLTGLISAETGALAIAQLRRSIELRQTFAVGRQLAARP